MRDAASCIVGLFVTMVTVSRLAVDGVGADGGAGGGGMFCLLVCLQVALLGDATREALPSCCGLPTAREAPRPPTAPATIRLWTVWPALADPAEVWTSSRPTTRRG